jgi:hypothetical protein
MFVFVQGVSSLMRCCAVWTGKESKIKQLLDQGLHKFVKKSSLMRCCAVWTGKGSKSKAAARPGVAQICQKSMGHPKILHHGRHCTTFHAEDPRVSGAIEQNVFVHPCVRTWGRKRYHPPKRLAVQHHIPEDLNFLQLRSENLRPCCSLEIRSYAEHVPVTEGDCLLVGEEIPRPPPPVCTAKLYHLIHKTPPVQTVLGLLEIW